MVRLDRFGAHPHPVQIGLFGSATCGRHESIVLRLSRELFDDHGCRIECALLQQFAHPLFDLRPRFPVKEPEPKWLV